MPLGLRITSRKAASSHGVQAHGRQVEHDHRAVQHPHTTLSPNIVGSTLTRRSTGCPPTVRRMRPSCGNRRSAMSRLAMTLMRGGDGEGQVPRRRHHLVEHAVGADADLELVLEGLEVQVAGVVLDGQQEHHVQELADRGAVGQGLDAGQVERAVLLQGLRPRRPARRPAPCRRSASPRSRRPRRSSAPGP